MNILLIYPNLGISVGFNLGIALISAVLKRNSYNVKLLHLNEELGFPMDLLKIKESILEFKPDLIGFSVNTNQFPIGIKIAKFIKENINKYIPIVFGGIHVTLNPEETLKNDFIDFIVLGEGEETLLELVQKIEKKEKIDNIQNLWLKNGSKIIKNNLRPFLDLDSIPFMDVSIYDYQKIINLRNGWIDIMIGRGCNFSCTYCFNEAYRSLYSNKSDKNKINKYIRFENSNKTLEGIQAIIKNYENIKCITFVDDDFLINPNLIPFLRSLKEKVNIPFIINTNISSIKEHYIEELKNAGCEMIRIGVESGNEMIRRKILNRHIDNEQIINKIKIIQKHNIKSFTFNMIGLPTETKENVLETLKLNVKSSTSIVKISTFQPYKGTKIYTMCEKLQLISKEKRESLTYYDTSILNFDENHMLFLDKIQKYFDCYLNYYNPLTFKFYEKIIGKIDLLTREQFNDKEQQITIKNEIDSISYELSSKKVKHYAIKFAPYFAVMI